jgi:hypothetical protein
MEMMKTPLAVIVLLILYSSVVEATEEIGLEILDTCLSEQKAMQGDPVSSVRYGLCLGYLKGVADSLNGHGVCLPGYMNTVQLTQALKLCERPPGTIKITGEVDSCCCFSAGLPMQTSELKNMRQNQFFSYTLTVVEV